MGRSSQKLSTVVGVGWGYRIPGAWNNASSLIRDRPRVFVLSQDQVSGIVTRGDLQKAPVRMWLFGLISLFEMQLLRLIRLHYPNEAWKSLLTQSRLDGAQKILDGRAKRNEAIDLSDCLQFCDKKTVILKSEAIRGVLGIENRKELEDMLDEAQKLRNNLAHAQDIITGFWPEIVELAEKIEICLERCENVEGNNAV